MVSVKREFPVTTQIEGTKILDGRFRGHYIQLHRDCIWLTASVGDGAYI